MFHAMFHLLCLVRCAGYGQITNKWIGVMNFIHIVWWVVESSCKWSTWSFCAENDHRVAVLAIFSPKLHSLIGNYIDAWLTLYLSAVLIPVTCPADGCNCSVLFLCWRSALWNKSVTVIIHFWTNVIGLKLIGS